MINYSKSKSSNMIHICIDKYQDFQLQGRAYNNTVKEVIVFNDIHDLVLKIDSIFNANGNPLAFEEKRSFVKEIDTASYQFQPTIYNEYEEYFDIYGDIATMDIIVMTRMKSSWQGILYYQEQCIEFTDVLELIKIILELLHM